MDLGKSVKRWKDVYCTGLNNSSDRTLKQQIAPLSTAELQLAAALSKMFCNYKWNHRVLTKGDRARKHCGAVAQDVEACVMEHGLSPDEYAFFCKSTYYKTVEVDKDGDAFEEVHYTNGDHPEPLPSDAVEYAEYSLRYVELLCFVACATEHRLSALEERLSRLE